MLKFIIAINIAYTIGFILGDAFTGFIFQMVFVAGYALVKLVPGKAWLALGEGFADAMPWIFIYGEW
jgi:hypothetical protein